MMTLASQAIIKQSDFNSLRNQLSHVAAESFVPEQYIQEILVRSWEQSVDRFLNDSLLTKEEESQLMKFANHFGLTQQTLNQHGAFEKAAKAGILRELTEGTLPERVSVNGQLPFNFQKNEKLVWIFPGSHYYEERVSRSYAGRSSGVSIRIAKGVYYRVGGFTASPIQTTTMTHLDTGMAAFTTKHIYFTGPRKSLRVPFSKIVSFTPYSDGIGFQKDAATAKAQVLVTGDGWFTYNLAANLSQFEEKKD